VVVCGVATAVLLYTQGYYTMQLLVRAETEFFPCFGQVVAVDWTERLLTFSFLEPPPFNTPACVRFEDCPERMQREGAEFWAKATLRERDPARFEIKDFE
jgi:hypothetical protein